MPRLRTWTALLLLGFCACASIPSPNQPPDADTTAAKVAHAAAATEANAGAAAMRSWAAGQGAYFKRAWGVDIVGVRLVASDWMLEFKFRVLEADKAAPLLDQHTTPYLVDDASGARLAVPAMENVGELRQHTTPDPNRIYFMIFGNANKIVPRGGRVSVVIGKFEATGLPVQ